MSVVSFGELLIDFVALESGVTVGEASGFVKAPGGAPANVAVAVARLGCESAFIGQVGDDPFGHFLAGVLRADGVDTTGLTHTSEAMTALAFVSLREDGERSFSFYRKPSADMLQTVDDVRFDVIDKAKIFHYGSITLIAEPAKSALLKAAEYASQKEGMLVSYDPNLRLSLWESVEAAKAGMLAGMDYANLLKVSDEELEFLTGGNDVTPLWRDKMQMILVTHGAAGSTLYTRDQSFTAPGYKVSPVDTTGAGDTFVAGILCGILDYEDAEGGYLAHIDAILRFANAAAAMTTTVKGAIPGMPTREQVKAFINEQA